MGAAMTTTLLLVLIAVIAGGIFAYMHFQEEQKKKKEEEEEKEKEDKEKDDKGKDKDDKGKDKPAPKPPSSEEQKAIDRELDKCRRMHSGSATCSWDPDAKKIKLTCTDSHVGPQCQYKKDRCNSMDAAATIDDDGKCTCSAAYFGETCTACNAANGFSKVTDANGASSCKKLPQCRIVVTSTQGNTADVTPKISKDHAGPFDMDLNKYNLTHPKTIKIKRVSGTGACSAAFTVDSCVVIVDLPEDRDEAQTVALRDGKKVTRVQIGTKEQIQNLGLNLCSSDAFAARPSECDSNTEGNICHWFW